MSSTGRGCSEKAARGRRRALVAIVVVMVALFIAAGARVAASRVLASIPPIGSPTRSTSYTSTGGWPAQGQGAYVLGDGVPAVSPNEKPVPIASVAKVMTAYLVLKKYPLAAGCWLQRQDVHSR